MIVYTIGFLCVFVITNARHFTDYTIRRNNIIQNELKHSTGGSLVLSDDEITANDIIMRMKHKEVDEKFHNPQPQEFWERAEKSEVYQIIKKMPKGAALHIHSSFMLDADRMIALTHEFEDNLYACHHTDLKLHFSDSIPTGPCPVNWTLLSELRNKSGDPDSFDRRLKRHFCFITSAKKDPYESINNVWERFERTHKTIQSLIAFRPVREKFFYNALENFYNDNVMYVEIRSSLSKLYELDGYTHEKMYLAKLYKNVTEQFIKTHPDFVGFKFIISTYRGASNEKVGETIKIAKELKLEMPEYFAGFDLVGQEDKGRPLIDFLPEFKAVEGEMDFFFHGGETNWFGTPSDENLIDAILLGTKRIGHGYALLKHPSLIDMVKERDIAIEVNVVSNGVLSLLHDVRNHPLATFLALDIPVVLSSDDPSAFWTEPLSHDFYLSFVGVASRHYDIRMLKKLALNSIQYSALDDKRKNKFYASFNSSWNEFVQNLIASHD